MKPTIGVAREAHRYTSTSTYRSMASVMRLARFIRLVGGAMDLPVARQATVAPVLQGRMRQNAQLHPATIPTTSQTMA
jgi:hypothetical protein